MPTIEYEGRTVVFGGTYTGSYDCLNHGRFYEQPFLEHVRSLGLRGTYMDIGTNIGNHAMYFALFCQSDRVIGFEPVPHWRARALSNLAENGCASKVDVNPFGLLDKPCVLDFKPYDTTFHLNCKTLDDAFPTLSGVGFAKMDIEGSEPKAMLGGKEFFRRNRPLIFAEVLGDPAELLAAADAIGYRHSGVIFPGTPMYELVPR